MNEQEQNKQNVIAPLGLIQLLWQTSKCAEVHVDTLLTRVGLSHAKLWGLSHLVQEQEPLQLRHLAQRMGGAKSNATQLVDRMVADGLVQRVFDPADRRNTLIEVTPEGRERYTQGMRLLEDAAHTILAQFTPEQYTQLVHHLQHLRTAFPGKNCES